MEDYVVPLVCGWLWILAWGLGFMATKCGTRFSSELVVQPDGWPLSNFAAWCVELLAFVAGMIAFLVIKGRHDMSPVTGFDAIVGLNIAVYALLLLFLAVFSWELWQHVQRVRSSLWGTLLVVVSYNACQLALVFLYGMHLETYQESAPFVLGLFVMIQKLLDVFWVLRRRAALG